MKTLTVFTPTYNRAHTLPRLYQSLCSQTSQDFDWLVIDDGSTDETKELIGGFSDLGNSLSTDEVKSLAAMPSKNELIAQVVAQLLSPVTDSVSGLTGGVSDILSGLEAHAN